MKKKDIILLDFQGNREHFSAVFWSHKLKKMGAGQQP